MQTSQSSSEHYLPLEGLPCKATVAVISLHLIVIVAANDEILVMLL